MLTLVHIVRLSKRILLRTFPNFFSPAKQYYQRVGAMLFSRNLDKLAFIFGTDKYGTHHYTQHYQTHFKDLRSKKLSILEIGVGGYDKPFEGGNSLRMWKHYFHNSDIFAIDIHDKSSLEEDRITIFRGNQNDIEFLTYVLDKMAGADIVIDDGSHINEDVIISFNYIFPRLSPNGIYVIEDTHTSYVTRYGGNSEDLNNPKTTMGYFKQLADELNHSLIKSENYVELLPNDHLMSVSFFENLIIIKKNNARQKP